MNLSISFRIHLSAILEARMDRFFLLVLHDYLLCRFMYAFSFIRLLQNGSILYLFLSPTVVLFLGIDSVNGSKNAEKPRISSTAPLIRKHQQLYEYIYDRALALVESLMFFQKSFWKFNLCIIYFFKSMISVIFISLLFFPFSHFPPSVFYTLQCQKMGMKVGKFNECFVISPVDVVWCVQYKH